ncbi:MAG: hypothetical protein JKY65_22560 [Planctomycetes bacterium]|nr:hypothetical protein [Planctomycetota bacterium]
MAAILLLATAGATLGQESKDPLPQVDRKRRVVRFEAVLHLHAFEKGEPPGHHLITWRRGRAGKHALLQTAVSDRAVLDALESLGAKPGDNLVEESWTERANPSHPAPDLRAKGPKLSITIVIQRPKQPELRIPVEKLLVDRDKRGFDWRVAGNRDLIKRWRSGCVVCLQSCPGSKVANAKATMRHLHAKASRFKPSKLAVELGEGAQVTVELALARLPESRPTRDGR